MGFVTFNLIEGIFWILLGIIAALRFFAIGAKYKKLAPTAAAILILFGISDFAEIAVEESFLDSLTWLWWWKIAGIMGIIVVIAWYIKLRLS